jgi:hypothetical protein
MPFACDWRTPTRYFPVEVNGVDSRVCGKPTSVICAALVLAAALLLVYLVLAETGANLALWRDLLAGWFVGRLSLVIGFVAAYLFGPLVWNRFPPQRAFSWPCSVGKRASW